MKLDITEIMNKRKERLDFSLDFVPEEGAELAGLPYGVSFASPVRTDVTAVDVNGFIRLTFDISVTLKVTCMRCLDEFELPFEHSFERYAGEGERRGYRTADEENDADEDVLTIRDSAVFPDADIMEEISLNVPEYNLCSEDCPGLCQVCGKKLGSLCTCGAKREEKRTDPRNDVFRELLAKMEAEEKGEDGN